MSDIQFAVGMSKKWDPGEAGREAASKAISQLKDKPKFMLIFCTIHYDNQKNGLKKLIKGCRELVEDDVPSVGGTMAGFICPGGCHTRGTVVVVASGENIDVAGAFSKNIFRDPYSSGIEVASDINNVLMNSKRRSKILFEFPSGPIEPKIVMNRFIRKIFKKIPSIIAPMISDTLLFVGRKYFQYGASVEEYVNEKIIETIPDCYMIGGSTFDDLKVLRHYQFYNKEVSKRAISALGISVNNKVIVDKKVSLSSTGRKMKINRGWGNYSITKINNKPAVSQYIKEMNWPEDYSKILHVDDVGKKTWYLELGFIDNGEIYPIIRGLFFGEIIWVGGEIKKDEIEIFLTSM